MVGTSGALLIQNVVLKPFLVHYDIFAIRSASLIDPLYQH